MSKGWVIGWALLVVAGWGALWDVGRADSAVRAGGVAVSITDDAPANNPLRGMPPADLDRGCLASVWRDEFEAGLSASRTGQGVRYATEYHWGDSGINNELQYYAAPDQADVFRVVDGVLSITAIKPAAPLVSRVTGAAFGYASGLLHTKASFARSRGLWEIRARLPKGRGLWPAFWLVPTVKPAGYWRDPEVDVLEVLGHDTRKLYATMHTKTPPYDGGRVAGEYRVFGTGVQTEVDLSAGWHVYGVELSDAALHWYLDGRLIKREPMPADFANAEWYLLANLAVGGNWPGSPDSATLFPAGYEIDWIRVWQRTPGCNAALAAPDAPVLVEVGL